MKQKTFLDILGKDYRKVELGNVLNEHTALYIYMRKSSHDNSQSPDFIEWGDMVMNMDEYQKNIPNAYLINSKDKNWKAYIQSNYFHFSGVKK